MFHQEHWASSDTTIFITLRISKEIAVRSITDSRKVVVKVIQSRDTHVTYAI
jgi:hypothetical protein